MKTRRENVIAAIEFGTPDRLPVVFDAFGVSDVHRVRWNQIGTGDHEKKLTFDEWRQLKACCDDMAGAFLAQILLLFIMAKPG